MNLLSMFIDENAMLAGGLLWLAHKRGGTKYLKAKFSGSIPNLLLTHWTHRHSQFLSLLRPALANRRPIIFLGDSLTEQGEWGEMFGSGTPVVNRGISGDTSRGLLRRLDEIIALQPRAVFLMIGTNDPLLLHLTSQETARNIGVVVEKLHTALPDVAVYVQSILPVFDPMRSNAWIEEANTELQKIENGQNVRYLDLFDHFLEGDELGQQYSSDGLHLNGEGYSLWANVIAPHVRAHFDAPEIPKSSAAASG